MEYFTKKIREGCLSFVAEVKHDFKKGTYDPEEFADEIEPWHVLLVTTLFIIVLPIIFIARPFYYLLKLFTEHIKKIEPV